MGAKEYCTISRERGHLFLLGGRAGGGRDFEGDEREQEAHNAQGPDGGAVSHA